MNKVNVQVGNWYQDHLNQTFEVVAIDEDEETIEVQYFDGGVEELEFETWVMTAPQEVDAPEDISGAYGDVASENLGYSEEDRLQPENWSGPVETIEPEG